MRITPWKSRSELEQLKQWLFVDATVASKKRAIQRIDAYLTRGPYLPHIIEYTVRLMQCQLNDDVEDEEDSNDRDVENLKWNYCMVLIRFVNGMLDPVQQGQFAIPLHKLAENIGLPSWFVELRHLSTHERELPSLEMLRLCCKEAIQWTWDNYWNNDEWENEDDEDPEDEEDPEGNQDSQKKREKEEQIARLKALFKEYLDLKKPLREREYLWKRLGITRSAFGEQDLSQDRELVLLSDWLSQLKTMWKQDNKDTFVEFITLHCDETLLEICLNSLETFEVRGMEWLIDNYDKKIKNEETSIGDRFTNYKKLLKFLKRYCSLIDGRKLLSNGSFGSLVEKYDNYLVIYILQQLLSGDSSSYSRKKKKSSELDAKRVMDRITAHGVRDVELELFNTRKRASSSSSSTAEPVPEDSPALDILQDLQNLKSQFKRVKQESKNITNWQEAPDWEPKPFGVI